MVLEGENAIAQEPRDHGRYQPGQGRGRHPPQDFAKSIVEKNTVHGSDSAEKR